jgi:hypothetical protein
VIFGDGKFDDVRTLRPAAIFAAVLLLWILNSCATPPRERIYPPDNLLGLFSGRDGPTGHGVILEVRFFPGGTAHFHSYWEDDGNSYSEAGTYRYWPDSGRLEITFAVEVSSVEISTLVAGEPAAFTAEGIKLVRREDPVLPLQPLHPADIMDRWMMYYQYEGELVEVTLDLESSGLFVETTRYFGAEDDLVETGRYELDRQTGLISFFYSPRQEYGYTGYYDAARDALYTSDGDFYRES